MNDLGRTFQISRDLIHFVPTYLSFLVHKYLSITCYKLPCLWLQEWKLSLSSLSMFSSQWQRPVNSLVQLFRCLVQIFGKMKFLASLQPLTNLLTYVSNTDRPEQRALVEDFLCWRLAAITFTWRHLNTSFTVLLSLCRFRRYEPLGLPLLRWPCGFQSRVYRQISFFPSVLPI